MSGCLAGRRCGVDGTTYGEHPVVAALLGLPNVRAIDFCPEEAAFGVPRATANIYNGDGFDVLDGRARVKTDDGDDWTDGMIRAAHRMLDIGRTHQAHLAVLMDISSACGSQVIYDGPRHLGAYRAGLGVATALLVRSGLPVVSQRDYRTLGIILRHLGHPELAPPDGRDHHESDWYVLRFGAV